MFPYYLSSSPSLCLEAILIFDPYFPSLPLSHSLSLLTMRLLAVIAAVAVCASVAEAAQRPFFNALECDVSEGREGERGREE